MKETVGQATFPIKFTILVQLRDRAAKWKCSEGVVCYTRSLLLLTSELLLKFCWWKHESRTNYFFN